MRQQQTSRMPLALLLLVSFAVCSHATAVEPALSPVFPAWVWAIILFVFCSVMGVLAVMAGVGGGVLFVPFVGAFFPFHMDFVRGASLFVALAGAVTASGGLMRKELTFPRLVLPLSVASSSAAIVGAMVGLALPENVLRILLALTIGGICAIMAVTKRSEFPTVPRIGRVAEMLGARGSYHEQSTGENVAWYAHRVRYAVVLFLGIGFLAGLFGLGAGWANVPVLNLVMGVPLKVAVASSLLIVSVSDTAPAFIYLNSGAVMPIIAVPAVLGMMLGSRVGVHVVARTRPKVVRYFVLTLLGLAAIISLLKGLNVL